MWSKQFSDFVAKVAHATAINLHLRQPQDRAVIQHYIDGALAPPLDYPLAQGQAWHQELAAELAASGIAFNTVVPQGFVFHASLDGHQHRVEIQKLITLEGLVIVFSRNATPADTPHLP